MDYLNLIDQQTLVVFIQLIIATFLGMMLGVERTVANKTAGMRTYALISMGSALFVIISKMASVLLINFPSVNPLYIPAQIVVGIGFIGAGLIFVHGNTVNGLTTAAGLWVAAGIGMAVGFEFYSIAIFVTILTLFIFLVLFQVEDKIKHIAGVGNNENYPESVGK
ncbi:MAG: MgtC/SapB family protein [bacterium]